MGFPPHGVLPVHDWSAEGKATGLEQLCSLGPFSPLPPPLVCASPEPRCLGRPGLTGVDGGSHLAPLRKSTDLRSNGAITGGGCWRDECLWPEPAM